MSTTGTPGTSNLPAFLTHLEERNVEQTQFARLLLVMGWRVQEFWGPVQMDVWRLILTDENWCLEFGVERGFAGGVMFAPGSAPPPGGHGMTWFGLATFAYAARTGDAPPVLDAPSWLPERLMTYGVPTLRWLSEGNTAVVHRVDAAWRSSHDAEGNLRRRTRGQYSPEEMRAVRVEALEAMRRAALAQ